MEIRVVRVTARAILENEVPGVHPFTTGLLRWGSAQSTPEPSGGPA
jgi:hypothetical protein